MNNSILNYVMLMAAGPDDPLQQATNFITKLEGWAEEYGTKALVALVIMVVGWIIARWLGNLTQRGLDKQQLEPPVKLLLVRLVRFLFFLATLMVALETAGLPILTLITGIGVAGIGVGLATQGILGNFFAGLVIIFTKPFKVGEYVELLTVQGEVKHIDLLSTILLHPDLSKVVIPNHKILGEILHNYGHIRQLSLNVGVGYELTHK